MHHLSPPHLSAHDEQVEDVAASSRVWRFFVREQWVDIEDAAADKQRRALIERWATADQVFRDVNLEF
ncbi:hypothetical protein N7495_001947 [Penicillium taxi]|uniref:uncharacterized protein n=1 Tax=Penicillium taxi TaxID=168475 RepID=UPI0025455F0E|nr:uncharacterized protein N7495_001947 [Penicillium taxi]KAJ5909265.1 hypothetical protein N7495_001947 [Penicillium taxi]